MEKHLCAEYVIFLFLIKLCGSLGLQVPLVCPLFQFPETDHSDASGYYYFYHELQSWVQVYEIILALVFNIKVSNASQFIFRNNFSKECIELH